MKITGTMIVLFVIFALLGLADIGLNALSLIPWIGSIVEGLSEAVLELLQGVVVIILVVLAGRDSQ